MNKRKRFSCLLLSFVLGISLFFAGCNKEEAVSSSQSESSSVSSTQSSEYISSSDFSQTIGPMVGTSSSEALSSQENHSSQRGDAVCSEPGYYMEQEYFSTLTVTTGNVMLQNKTIYGDLEVTVEAANQPITLSNVTVAGNLILRGGGIVTLENVSAETLYAQKESDPLYLLLQGGIDIPQAMIGGEMIMQDSGITSGGIQSIFLEQIDAETPAGTSSLELQGVTLTQLVANQQSAVKLFDGSYVENVWANAPTKIQGTGMIRTLNCASNGVTYQTAPGEVLLGEGVTAPTVEMAVSSSVVRIPSASSRPASSRQTYYVTRNGIRVYSRSSSTDTSGNRLEEPNLDVVEDDGNLYISWDRVSNASGYRVELRSGTGSGRLLESEELDKYKNSYTTDYEVEKDTDYTVRVKAYAMDGYIDSSYAEKEYNSTSGDFRAPNGLKLTLVNEYLEATWDSMDEADYYEVLLYDPDGTIAADTTTELPFCYFDDVELEETGRYAVRVRAIDFDKDTVSAYASTSLRVDSSDRKILTPVVTAEFVGDALDVTWDDIDHARSYTLRLRREDTDNYLVRSVSTTDTYYSFDEVNFKKGTKYVVEVRANAKSGYQNSEFAKYATDYYGVGW